jgi:hypothetical protein
MQGVNIEGTRELAEAVAVLSLVGRSTRASSTWVRLRLWWMRRKPRHD